MGNQVGFLVVSSVIVDLSRLDLLIGGGLLFFFALISVDTNSF